MSAGSFEQRREIRFQIPLWLNPDPAWLNNAELLGVEFYWCCADALWRSHKM
jgi:hypothetical protein